MPTTPSASFQSERWPKAQWTWPTAASAICALVFGIPACQVAHGAGTKRAAEVTPAAQQVADPSSGFAVAALAEPEDYVVRIVGDHTSCTGTLISEDQVLTARHCVTVTTGDTGQPHVLEPGQIQIELGGDYLPWGEVGIRAIVAPPCGPNTSLGDIAVLVLERELVGISVLAPELDRAPELGQKVRAIGFGRCALRYDGIRRQKRAGGGIESVAQDRFRLKAAICPGDSGGPGLLKDGTLLGVISAAEMDGDEASRGVSEFTRVDAWRPVFGLAQLIAEGREPAELPPLDCPEG